jgi:crotonobetainyl-CoA:carnitine CoA-transferase CaiB-like acyl-CoA transferase
MEDHQWDGLRRALGWPEWAEAFATSRDRTEHAEEIDARIAAVTGNMTKRDCEETLQRNGVPATAMSSPEELVASPQFRARGALRPFHVDGRTVTALGRPVQEAGERQGGEPSAASGLAGLRVLEAGHVLAVPLAGALLGAMGATVTKVEDPDRLDMYRRRGPFIDAEPGMERAAYFACVNHSKDNRLVSLDGSLDDLLDGCDVVMENFGP